MLDLPVRQGRLESEEEAPVLTESKLWRVEILQGPVNPLSSMTMVSMKEICQ